MGRCPLAVETPILSASSVLTDYARTCRPGSPCRSCPWPAGRSLLLQQYLVFMGVVGIDWREVSKSLLRLLAIGTIGGLLLDSVMAAPVWLDSYGRAFYGVFIGLVMTHFVYDAGIWRLREPFQRGYMRKKFAFVFDRR
jgi:hypothetical protein